MDEVLPVLSFEYVLADQDFVFEPLIVLEAWFLDVSLDGLSDLFFTCPLHLDGRHVWQQHLETRLLGWRLALRLHKHDQHLLGLVTDALVVGCNGCLLRLAYALSLG